MCSSTQNIKLKRDIRILVREPAARSRLPGLRIAIVCSGALYDSEIDNRQCTFLIPSIYHPLHCFRLYTMQILLLQLLVLAGTRFLVLGITGCSVEKFHQLQHELPAHDFNMAVSDLVPDSPLIGPQNRFCRQSVATQQDSDNDKHHNPPSWQYNLTT